MKSTIRQFVPPALLHFWRRWRSPVTYRGSFASWEDAATCSRGYAQPEIVARVRRGVREVLAGRAAFERDGTTFTTTEYMWPLLACLLHAAARNHGRLHVVDFGGSLGSTFLQHRSFLPGLANVQWQVVEQPAWVEAGREDLAIPGLTFHHTLDEIEPRREQVLLLSGVLQYLPTPHDFLREVVARGFDHVIIDRTGVHSSGSQDHLTVQRTRPPLYSASYPCWFFAESRLAAHFSPLYEQRATWLGPDFVGRPATAYRGFYYVRQTP